MLPSFPLVYCEFPASRIEEKNQPPNLWHDCFSFHYTKWTQLWLPIYRERDVIAAENCAKYEALKLRWKELLKANPEPVDPQVPHHLPLYLRECNSAAQEEEQPCSVPKEPGQPPPFPLSCPLPLPSPPLGSCFIPSPWAFKSYPLCSQ